MNRSKQQALLLLTFAWLCLMGARAGSVVVDATRTFQVGQNLKDLQDPPLVLSAQITDSTIVDLSHHCLVSTQQQLLTCLTTALRRVLVLSTGLRSK